MIITKNLKEAQQNSSAFRIMTNTLYRAISYAEGYKIVNETLARNGRRIAINLAHVYFYEHIRDYAEHINGKNNYNLILTGPALVPKKEYKKEVYRYYENKYGFEYGKDIVPHPWLKKLDLNVYLEVSITTYGDELKCPRLLYTHGMGGLSFSKDVTHVRYLRRYKALLLNGPMQKRVIESNCRRMSVPIPEMYEVGYLRGDRMLKMQEHLNKKQFLAQIGLTCEKTVIYAPTWGEFSSVDKWIEEIINICETMKVNLILRLHPIMMTGGSYWENKGINIETIKELVEHRKNTIIYTDHNLDSALIASDVLVTDVSGMSMEFMALGKPALHLPAPRYFEIYGSERPEKWCRVNSEVESERQLISKLQDALSGNKINISAEELTYNRGHVLETMSNCVEAICR